MLLLLRTTARHASHTHVLVAWDQALTQPEKHFIILALAGHWEGAPSPRVRGALQGRLRRGPAMGQLWASSRDNGDRDGDFV